MQIYLQAYDIQTHVSFPSVIVLIDVHIMFFSFLSTEPLADALLVTNHAHWVHFVL